MITCGCWLAAGDAAALLSGGHSGSLSLPVSAVHIWANGEGAGKIDHVFVSSRSLDGEAVVVFARALCTVSKEELHPEDGSAPRSGERAGLVASLSGIGMGFCYRSKGRLASMVFLWRCSVVRMDC